MNDYEYLLSYLAEDAANVVEAGEKVVTPKKAKSEKASVPTVSSSATPAASQVTVNPGSLPAEDKQKKGPEVIQTAPVPQTTSAPNTLSDLWNKGITVPSLPSLSDLPEPGGIGMLLFLILLILFAFQSAGPNGETRLSLIWSTIRGSASLAGEQSLSSVNPNGSGPTVGQSLGIPGSAPTISSGLAPDGRTITLPNGVNAPAGTLGIGR